MDLNTNQESISQDGTKRRRRRGAKGRETSGYVDEARERPRNDTETKSEIPTEKTKTKTTKKRKGKPPKPGEEGYLSPTQLRNARKRRAKKSKQNDNTSSGLVNTAENGTGNENNVSVSSKKSRKFMKEDPSTKFLSKPLACPLVEKAKQYFLNLEVPFQTYLGDLKGWRTVSKLPVRRKFEDNKETCIIGLFQPNSHTIVAVPNCIAHHPSINFTINSLQTVCNDLKIEPFEEKDGSGYLRYICMNVDRSSKLVQLTLVWNSSWYDENEEGDRSKGKEQLDKLTQKLISQKKTLKIHSLWVHFNAQWKHADNIFDFGTPTTCNKLWKHIYGPKEIVETLDISDLSENVKLHFPPNVFRQANLDAFTKIVVAIRNYILQYNKERANKKKGLPSCLELYGGVGTIGLHLHDVTSNLLSSDENPFNKDCFMKSVKLMSVKTQGKIAYVSKNSTSVTKDKDSFPKDNKAEILVVDPPRKGFDDFVLKSLTQNRDSSIFNETKLLVYVSCGFDAFQRDCNALLKSKKWTLEHAEGHVLFPGSNAIETLAFFKSK